MSERDVLDASAVLAILLEEPGAELVRAALPGALLSSVNLAEVFSKLAYDGVPVEEVRAGVADLQLRIVPLDEETAETAGRLRILARSAGLSLGDRCCLALTHRLGGVAITADRRWASFADALGVQVRLIRPFQ